MFISLLAPKSVVLLDAEEALIQLIGFFGSFGMIGALGYRFVVLPPAEQLVRSDEVEAGELAAMRSQTLQRAALIGAAGSLLLLLEALPGVSKSAVPVVLAALAIASYLAAAFGVGVAWYLNILLAIGLTFQKFIADPSKWTSLVNPLHRTAASLWLGTLFVLVIAGLPAVLRYGIPGRRVALITTLVQRFSPLALVGAAVLLVSGATTAWLHLHTISTLWTTPYGYALIAKLCVVAMVAAHGAWNWRRLTPRLGTEAAAHTLRRSSRRELVFAALVLAITAVLVSLPSPKAPKANGATPPPATAPQ